MRSLTIACSIYLTVAMQSSVITGEWQASFPVFLPMLTIALIALWTRGALALVWSASVGLLLDGLSTERMGIQMSLAVVIAWSLQTMIENGRLRSTTAWLTAGFLAVLFWRSASPWICSVLDGQTIDVAAMLTVAGIEAAATTVLAGLLVWGSYCLLSDPRSRDNSILQHHRWRMVSE